MCNKRPLHQPASNSYCGSVQRELYNPFNHGRAEKAGGYSSRHLFVLVPHPCGTPNRIHPNTARQKAVPRPSLASRRCRRSARCTLPRASSSRSLAGRLEDRSEGTAAAQRSRLRPSPGAGSDFGDGSVLLPRTPSYSLASAGRKLGPYPSTYWFLEGAMYS